MSRNGQGRHGTKRPLAARGWPLAITTGLLLGIGPFAGARAQVIVDDALTGASSSYDWEARSGACLTAGNGTGSIPACVGLPYYSGSPLIGGNSGTLPDPVGKGALRLTNGDQALGAQKSRSKRGAVIARNPFPATQGLRATFTTVTYGGNGGYDAGGVMGYLSTASGADGISFFLADAASPITLGADGGSLGYTCANKNDLDTGVHEGVVGGYLGVGIDEFGNFSDPTNMTDTGPGVEPGKVSLRGAGSTAFSSLNARYPSNYPNSLTTRQRNLAVQSTCKTGTVWNFSNASRPVDTGTRIPYNYRYMGGVAMPTGITISNQQGLVAPKRAAATPISYGLDLTQDGLLSVSVSVAGGLPQTIISNQSITATNGPIPSQFRFGFAAGTGHGSNIHEILCFRAAPSQASSGSAALNQSSKVQVGTQVYLGSFNPTNWWGSVTAQNIV